MTRAECEYPNRVEIEEGSLGYRREQVEMSGLTQERCSEIPEGESGSWLEGISELTKSEEYRQYTTTIYRGNSLGQALRTDLVSRDDGDKQMMREIKKDKGRTIRNDVVWER